MNAPAPLSIRHSEGLAEVEHGAISLLRLDARSRAPLEESPRPFVHPMRTPGGTLASDLAPPDHAWHHGLSMTCAALKRGRDIFNFWGGPTFVRGQGYVHLANHGTQQAEPPAIDIHNDTQLPRATLRQNVRWMIGEEVLVEEERALQVLAAPHLGAWRLRWSSRLRNVCGEALRWGSPTTEGRPNAGYGGLFWRGPRSPIEACVAYVGRGSSTCGWLHNDEEMMGRPMRAGEDLIFRARTEEGSFLLACESMKLGSSSGELNWEPRWFARVSVPMVAWAFSFEAERVQEPGERWRLEHRLAMLDSQADQDFDAERLSAVWAL